MIKDIQGKDYFSARNWVILFVDFKAVFGRVDHVKLLAKLSNARLKDPTLEVIKIL